MVYSTPSGANVLAIDQVSLEFPAESSTAVVGRSGSGKSTLVAILALLRQPTSGHVTIAGTDVSQLPATKLAVFRAERIGVVFQSFHLDASLTAAENVMLAWYVGGQRSRKRQATRHAISLLKQLGIEDLAHRRTNEMSGGQQQRVAIARALFVRPSLLIADEPTGNLDEETAEAVVKTLLMLPSEFGTAVVTVTHDLAVAKQHEQTVTLSKGRLVDEGA